MWTFILNVQFWLFGPYLRKKNISCPEQKKCTSPSSSAYLTSSRHHVSSSTDNFRLFERNLPKLRIFGRNQKIKHYNGIRTFKLVRMPSFTLNRQFSFFGPNFYKKGILSPEEKIEHDNWIQDARVILYVKFHLKQTILSFWT